MAQLVTYSQTRETLAGLGLAGWQVYTYPASLVLWCSGPLQFQSGLQLAQGNLVGALLSGVVVAVVINPFDVVSTRIYNQPSGSAVRLYSGYVDCLAKVAAREGVAAFYKGLTAQYLR